MTTMSRQLLLPTEAGRSVAGPAASKGTTAISPRGRSWHARRTLAGAPMRASVRASSASGAGQCASPPTTTTPHAAHRHVWNVVAPARFQNRPSSRDLHDAVRICNRDEKVAAVLDERPDL